MTRPTTPADITATSTRLNATFIDDPMAREHAALTDVAHADQRCLDDLRQRQPMGMHITDPQHGYFASNTGFAGMHRVTGVDDTHAPWLFVRADDYRGQARHTLPANAPAAADLAQLQLTVDHYDRDFLTSADETLLERACSLIASLAARRPSPAATTTPSQTP